MVRSFVIVFIGVGFAAGHLRTPPGINPNTYQKNLHHDGQPPPIQPQFHQEVPKQHYQQQHEIHQQPPVQQHNEMHQQPPVQQHQEIHQQPPVQQQHEQNQPHHQQEAHGHNQGPNPAILHKDMSHEKEHMMEHMDVPLDTSSMSEQELQFHYFKMHDSDGNNKLDGCELVKSLIHWHDGDSHDGHDHELPPHYEDGQLAAFIDPVLKADDINNDGMIDYAEFIAAQLKTRSGLRQPVEISI